MAGMSFNEKKSRFRETFRDVIRQKYDEKQRFLPLNFTSCNGDGEWPFTDACVNYIEPDKSLSFPIEVWFKNFYVKFARELNGKTEIIEEEIPVIEQLIDFADYVSIGRNHLPCLRSILNDDICEAKVMVVLALHYFKPLAYEGSLTLDNKCKHFDICELCRGNLKPLYGDTTFGNPRVWHGCADIVLQRSVIKVFLEDELSKLQLDEDEDEDENNTNVNVHGNVTSSSSFSDIEVKLDKEENIKKKAKSEAIAQTIVNAFCEVSRDNTLHNKFIPSFMATEKQIRIILYNCEFDQLLMSEQCPIWEDSGELNVATMIKVWLALNYSHKLEDNISEHLMKNACSSGFKSLVGNFYSVYSTEIQRPLKHASKKEPKRKGHLDSDSLAFLIASLTEIYSEL